MFRSGENWTDSTDPCVRYHCNQGRVEEERLETKCEKIEECVDGKAPFHVRGMCCLQCRKCMRRGSLAGEVHIYCRDALAVITSPPPPADLTQVGVSDDSVATLSEWSEWEPCSRSCGSGRRSRSRQCKIKSEGLAQVVAVDCKGSLQEVEFCNPEPCPSKTCHGAEYNVF